MTEKNETWGKVALVRKKLRKWRKIVSDENARIQYFGDVICATARNSMEKIYMYHRRRMFRYVYEQQRIHFQPSHVVIILYFPVRTHAAPNGPPFAKYPPSHMCAPSPTFHTRHAVTSCVKWNVTDYCYQWPVESKLGRESINQPKVISLIRLWRHIVHKRFVIIVDMFTSWFFFYATIFHWVLGDLIKLLLHFCFLQQQQELSVAFYGVAFPADKLLSCNF